MGLTYTWHLWALWHCIDFPRCLPCASFSKVGRDILKTGPITDCLCTNKRAFYLGHLLCLCVFSHGFLCVFVLPLSPLVVFTLCFILPFTHWSMLSSAVCVFVLSPSLCMCVCVLYSISLIPHLLSSCVFMCAWLCILG